MEIIEKFIFGKTGNADICEDGMVVGDNLVAVVDGATAKGKRLFNGKQSGAFAREVLCEVLNQEGIEKMSCEDLLTKLNDTLRERSEMCHQDLEYAEYPRASVIIYNSCYNEIWCYGDCQCIINGKFYSHEKELDALLSQLRSFYLEYALLEGEKIESFSSHDTGREIVLENFKKQVAFENRAVAFGYSVINGFGINPQLIERHKVQKGDEIVLSSDGYPSLRGTLSESEEELKRILCDDPMCFRLYKSTKGLKEGNLSFDDRCYVRFKA